jgi:glycosyl transferase/beta-hydroxylase protein BlmF
MKIAVLTPSRSRPGRLEGFLNSVHSLAHHKENIFTYNYVDDDDPRILAYKDLILENNEIIYGPAQSVSISWNVIAKKAISDGADILIMGNDDVVYHTHGWDTHLIEHLDQYPDDIYCAWFNDKINGENHCAFPIVSRKWYNTLGYFTPGIFKFGYNDTWVYDIAKMIDRTKYIDEVVAEHRHFTTGKMAPDETTKRNREASAIGNLYALDRITYEDTIDMRKKDAEKLMKVMKEGE